MHGCLSSSPEFKDRPLARRTVRCGYSKEKGSNQVTRLSSIRLISNLNRPELKFGQLRNAFQESVARRGGLPFQLARLGGHHPETCPCDHRYRGDLQSCRLLLPWLLVREFIEMVFGNQTRREMWRKTLTVRPGFFPPSSLDFSKQMSECCCPRRNKLPVTVTRFKATKTKTVVASVVRKPGAALSVRFVAGDIDEDVDDLATDPSTDHEIFARHACPVCPAGKQVVSAGRNKGGASDGISFCCTRRKTVTKTLKRTLTKTVSVRAVSVSQAPGEFFEWN